LPQMRAGATAVAPSVAPPAVAGYWEKDGLGAIFFPSSKRSRLGRSGPELARAATQLQGYYDGCLPEVLAEAHGPAAVAKVLLVERHGEGAINVGLEQGDGGTAPTAPLLGGLHQLGADALIA